MCIRDRSFRMRRTCSSTGRAMGMGGLADACQIPSLVRARKEWYLSSEVALTPTGVAGEVGRRSFSPAEKGGEPVGTEGDGWEGKEVSTCRPRRTPKAMQRLGRSQKSGRPYNFLISAISPPVFGLRTVQDPHRAPSHGLSAGLEVEEAAQRALVVSLPHRERVVRHVDEGLLHPPDVFFA